MIKIWEIGLFVAGLCIMFIFGYWCAGQRHQMDMQKENRLTTEYVEEHAENWLQGKIPKAWQYDLTEEEQDFLKQHVFGTWYFSKRIIALEERDEGIANFSEQGMEEIKGNVFIEYGRYNVESSGYTGETFSTTADIYLFAAYGGMTSVNYPVYHIEIEVEEERIALHHIYIEDNVSYAHFPEKCELVHVFYDLGYDERDNTSVDAHYAGDIYVDPKDTDILYLDFGGLWEMRREEAETVISRRLSYEERVEDMWCCFLSGLYVYSRLSELWRNGYLRKKEGSTTADGVQQCKKQ